MTAPASLEELRRRLRDAAHHAADQQTARVARVQAVASQRVIATVATITAGAASDGLAVIAVTWRNGTVTAAGYDKTKTFAVGDRVMCDLIDGQLLVDFPIGGTP